jgi:hypothetical protein
MLSYFSRLWLFKRSGCQYRRVRDGFRAPSDLDNPTTTPTTAVFQTRDAIGGCNVQVRFQSSDLDTIVTSATAAPTSSAPSAQATTTSSTAALANGSQQTTLSSGAVVRARPRGKDRTVYGHGPSWDMAQCGAASGAGREDAANLTHTLGARAAIRAASMQLEESNLDDSNRSDLW